MRRRAGRWRSSSRIPEQRVYVYRNGVEIAVSTCSTGKPGHSTPTGVFTILQKDKNHHSSTYNDAPMPNMERLTWSGIALHAGQLPGYPASHGCVRLPIEFSQKLFTVTHLGTPVIIANAASAPADVVHPGQVLDGRRRGRIRPSRGRPKRIRRRGRRPSAQVDRGVNDGRRRPTCPTRTSTRTTWTRPAAAHGNGRTDAGRDRNLAVAPRRRRWPTPAVPATAILVSSADKKIMILDNGEIVAEGSATIADPSEPLGHHVFILSNVNDTDRQLHWHTLGYGDTVGGDVDAADLGTIQRIRGDHAVIEAIRTRMHPGTVMITVDQPLSEDTRTARRLRRHDQRTG